MCVSMIVSDVGVRCQSVDALGWIQKCLEVVEKQVGLSGLWKLRGWVDPWGCFGSVPHWGSKAFRHCRHVQKLRGSKWEESWRQGEKQEWEESCHQQEEIQIDIAGLQPEERSVSPQEFPDPPGGGVHLGS